jgi:hypothetical protein
MRNYRNRNGENLPSFTPLKAFPEQKIFLTLGWEILNPSEGVVKREICGDGKRDDLDTGKKVFIFSQSFLTNANTSYEKRGARGICVSAGGKFPNPNSTSYSQKRFFTCVKNGFE